MKTTEIDLAQFCSPKPTRHDITAPFVRAGFRYATDGPECDADHECGDCNGTGKLPQPLGEKCETCEGSGQTAEYDDIEFGGRLLGGNYATKIARLPGLKFSVSGKANTGAYFIFEGGEGVVMPKTRRS